jgi:hypothetical protein
VAGVAAPSSQVSPSQRPKSPRRDMPPAVMDGARVDRDARRTMWKEEGRGAVCGFGAGRQVGVWGAGHRMRPDKHNLGRKALRSQALRVNEGEEHGYRVCLIDYSPKASAPWCCRSRSSIAALRWPTFFDILLCLRACF